MRRLTRITRSAPQTQAVGRALGVLLGPGDLVLLSGTLGAGKTTLTQGIAQGTGAEGYAHSPTFVLVHRYQGRISLFHMDLYRLSGPAVEAEAEELAVDEMLEEGAVVAEWAEHAPGAFPPERLTIVLSLAGPGAPDQRTLKMVARGLRAEALLDALAAALGAGEAAR
ncbi:MAG: tRNA (adenosine(37)-N6)-threonylcarbamoyltransferase complex ATPase subunit type 1 TsaE [Chloroflexota bacterium]